MFTGISFLINILILKLKMHRPFGTEKSETSHLQNVVNRFSPNLSRNEETYSEKFMKADRNDKLHFVLAYLQLLNSSVLYLYQSMGFQPL